jgi:hypothetical protein
MSASSCSGSAGSPICLSHCWSYYGMWHAEQGNLLKARDDLEQVRLAVLLNYSHGERRSHRSSRLELATMSGNDAVI